MKAKRSVVMGMRGVVATSQPLAANAGLDILKKGGNAIDAAVATAAVLTVVEPMSTSLGGDAFIMVYLAKEKKLVGLNASGRAAYEATLDKMKNTLEEEGSEGISGIYAVTVPGAVDGWFEILEQYGTMSMAEVLEPAIYYAENGFQVTGIIARAWEEYAWRLRDEPSSAQTWLIDGARAPHAGEVFVNKDLAATLKKIAAGGRDEFYKGSIARAIVDYSDQHNGFLTMKDFEDHTSTWVEPIYADYKNYRLYELPPNGQGIAALEMINILENIDLKPLGHNSADYLHNLIEAKKLAYADIMKWNADPEFNDLPVEEMLSKEYAAAQFRRIDPARAQVQVESGIPHNGDTVYLTTMDKEHNAVSFIYSIYNEFGSALTVPGAGFILQDRGALFSLEEGHVNVIEPHKRPFHTIIPAMVFKDGEFFMTYGIMGGSNQPQAHVQVLLNIVEFGMNIQEAIEAPRFRHYSGLELMPEPGMNEAVIEKLESMGHVFLDYLPGRHGGGQGIILDRSTGGMLGGSDHRKDGIAVAY
ncbi:gamma-glutamyltransferase [candidate division KSB1 bacterium]